MLDQVAEAVERLATWTETFGETSYDHQSYYAGPLGRAAKRLYYRHPVMGIAAVAPMVFSEAFIPWGRRFFWRKQRFPIADAHYAMGFAYLYEIDGNQRWLDRSLHFLKVLEETRSPGIEQHGWGYPFDWETRYGTISTGTPLITTLPYVYEAFREVYAIDGQPRWREILRSIAEHALLDYREHRTSKRSATSAYHPGDLRGGVINAAGYRAFLLMQAAIDFSDVRYREAAERNLNFVLESQQPEGCWYYATDSVRDFIDHFHTCFVLKALAKIEKLSSFAGCDQAIDKGVAYYLANLFDEKGLPKPFSRPPRLRVYRRELYDYAECVNLATLLRGRHAKLDAILNSVLEDLLDCWQKPNGSFRSRRLLVGWDDVPMHRWAQSQLFRSISFLLREYKARV